MEAWGREGLGSVLWHMPLGPLAANAYLVGDAKTREAAVVDPGQQPGELLRRLQEEGWRVRLILLTHAHADHVGGATMVAQWSGAPLYVAAAEESWLYDPRANLSAWITPEEPVRVGKDVRVRLLEGGETLAVGRVPIRVLGTPGHTPGSLSYHLPQAGAVLTGDTLFRRSVGRTDLPGGDPGQLLRSIRQELFSLPGETQVLPGHGPSSTVQEERDENPFVGVSDLGPWPWR
jgi:hydroxyacylglutathione hydrolase